MKVRCTNCGGDVVITQKTDTAICSFCHTALFIELTTGIPHIVFQEQINRDLITSYLNAELNKKELTYVPQIIKIETVYVPYWRFRQSVTMNILVAATEPLCEQIDIISEPSGKTVSYDDAHFKGAKILRPDLMQDEAASKAQRDNIIISRDDDIAALIYVPFSIITYAINNIEFTAYADKIMGKIYYDDFPATPHHQKSRTLALVAIVSFLIFFVQVYKFSGIFLLFSLSASTVVLYYGVLFALKRLGW